MLILAINRSKIYVRVKYYIFKNLVLVPPLQLFEHDLHDPIDHFGHSLGLQLSVVSGFNFVLHFESDTFDPFNSQLTCRFRCPPPHVAEHDSQFE